MGTAPYVRKTPGLYLSLIYHHAGEDSINDSELI